MSISISEKARLTIFADKNEVQEGNRYQIGNSTYTLIKSYTNSDNGYKGYAYQSLDDGKIYSKNLINLYGNINKDAKKVMRLKISNDTISFKDRLLGAWVGNYKWVKINRHTGQYTFNAKKDFGTWYRVANVSGFCKIVE